MDKKMLKIIGGFADGVYELTPQMVECRHHCRMVELCRQTFLEVCKKKNLTKLDMKELDMGYSYASLKEGEKLKYMCIHIPKDDIKEIVLFSLSDDDIKKIYKWLKTKM